MLIVDKTQGGKCPLFCAIGGLWPWGTGVLQLPARAHMMFFRLHPYLPLGSLQAALAYPADPAAMSDDEMIDALKRTGLGHFSNSLDRSVRWERELSSDEQTRLGLARLLLHKPRWIFSEDTIDVLEEDQHDMAVSIFNRELVKSSIVSISRRDMPSRFYSRVLHLILRPDSVRVA